MHNSNIVDSNIKSVSHIASEIVEIPGLDSLGNGYDVFDLYADPKSTKLDLFDLGEQEVVNVVGKTFNKPLVVDVKEILHGYFYSIFDTTLTEYLKMYNSKTKLEGSYNYFSGALSVDFQHEFIENRMNQYSKVIDLVEKWRLSLPYNNMEKLIKLLKKDVKNDLDKLPPDKLVEKYGTHFLQEVIVGAKCEYISATNQLATRDITNVSFIAELSYKQMTNQISASEEATYRNDIKDFNENSSIITNVYGGKPEYGHHINEKGDYTKWIESINDYPVFCNFTSNSLAPIWDLCESDSRKKEIKDAYDKYASENYSKPFAQKCITNLSVIGSSNSGIAPEYGYTKIDKDLNEGAGGKYIYLCYKEGLDNKEYPDNPVTNIDVIIADSLKEAKEKTLPNYTLIEYDLNSGAGGKYVYVCYTKDTNNKPIRSIQIIMGSNADIPATYGYTKIDKDLNTGAGGKYIYLCYSRNF